MEIWLGWLGLAMDGLNSMGGSYYPDETGKKKLVTKANHIMNFRI
jgi:hypothetical protein